MTQKEKTEIYFNDTCRLMRRYMRNIQPQNFASVWQLFETLKKRCEMEEVPIYDVSDIYEYAKKEKIEQYGF